MPTLFILQKELNILSVSQLLILGQQHAAVARGREGFLVHYQMEILKKIDFHPYRKEISVSRELSR
ncbi:MAG TPA: hypothetical protein PLT58_02635 [Atribacterota bacterium]|nr:hypothetical protein [Atribacterota bacterium]HOR42590.1 hypothetical protein [Atribacterota bacterium]